MTAIKGLGVPDGTPDREAGKAAPGVVVNRENSICFRRFGGVMPWRAKESLCLAFAI